MAGVLGIAPVSWLFLGAGLAVLPHASPVRARLAWIAMSRLAANQGVERTPLDRGSRLTSGASPLVTSLRRTGDSVPDDELRSCVAALIDEMDAGAAPAAAMRSVASNSGPQLAQRLAVLASAVEVGEMPKAADDVRDELWCVRVALSTAMKTGCSLRDVLAGAASEIEADLALRSAVTAAVAGSRASSRLLAGLPLLGLLLGSAMGARPLDVLWHESVGHVVLVVGLALEALGVIWTRQMVRRVLPC